MRIQVLYFAGLAQKLGCGEQFFDIKKAMTVGDFVLEMKASWKDADLLRMPLFKAVNEEYCDEHMILQEGDCLALLPPLAGG